jgi:hypothetical protein
MEPSGHAFGVSKGEKFLPQSRRYAAIYFDLARYFPTIGAAMVHANTALAQLPSAVGL